jgi:hypothetical protein
MTTPESFETFDRRISKYITSYTIDDANVFDEPYYSQYKNDVLIYLHNEVSVVNTIKHRYWKQKEQKLKFLDRHIELWNQPLDFEPIPAPKNRKN